MERNYDIIVVGAGVAGGIFAASQPKSTRVLVIERDLSEPDRIVGELMQPGGIEALRKLKLDYLLEDIDAQKVDGYNIINGDQKFLLHYDEIQKDIYGLGLRNGKFLTNIREDLRKRKNVTLIQGNVIELLEEEDCIVGVRYTQEDGIECIVNANLTVVCDGPMSILREVLSKPNKKVSSYFMGLILKDLKLKFPTYGQMIVSGESPILVYPVQSNAYRILIDYPGQKPPRLGEKSILTFKENVLKVLPEEMKEAFLRAVDEEQIKVMPNHSMKGQAFRKSGAVLLGDSLNMRHPLTGGGMTACFSDVITLNKSLKNIDFQQDEDLEEAINEYYSNRSDGVETINILANALYQVFVDKELKEELFEYLKKGGSQANEPLAILAGMNKSKKILLKHFYKLATQHPINFIMQPKKQFRLIKNSNRIILSTLKDEEISATV